MYANPKVKADYEAISSPADPLISPVSDVREALSRLAQAVSEPTRRKVRIDLAAEEMRRDLCDWLLHGDLYAYGFPAYPASDRTPRRIASEFWDDATIEWEKGNAAGSDRAFQRIRIIDPQDSPGIDLKPKIGRPSRKVLIDKAIKELNESNPTFEGEYRKTQIRFIREFIKAEYPELDNFGKGFGNDTIRKKLTAYYKSKNSN